MTSFRFNVGQFECILIQDGGGPWVAADAARTFGKSQAELELVLRQQHIDPAALQNSITPMIIKTGTQTVLVDSGLGGAKGNLTGHLSEIGMTADAIDLIVITHGHRDHIGGVLDEAGQFVFPNARYVFQSTEWDYWTAEDRFAPEDTNPIINVWKALKAHPELIRLIDADRQEAEIVPGLCAVAAPGHTIGHIALELSSGEDKLLHIADAAHSYVQLARPQWSPEFDYDKEQAADTRWALFERAAHDGALLSAYHFPFPGVGQIVEREGELHWEQMPGQ